MRRTVDQCPADIVLAPSGRPLTDLECVDDVVIFAKSNVALFETSNEDPDGWTVDRTRVCHDEKLYAEVDVVYRRMTYGRYQHLAQPSKGAAENRVCFFRHTLRRPADHLVLRVVSSSGLSWKRPPGRKWKLWNEVVKEDLRIFGVDRQLRRDARFRRIWNNDEWIDSVQAFAEDRECWAELCSRTTHFGEDRRCG
ncbi:hypothetical protein RB195_022722 [Necator americanus]|uniref:Uncharacterized protein n=1 Tax=Necator americanus TaxID=51031 RepID=A0ABR1EGB2_NECAM